MVYAVVARCPVFGGKVASFDATKAKAVPGVKNVVQISSGVAVVADNTWSAMQGRKALEIKWDEGPTQASSSDAIYKISPSGRRSPASWPRKDGDAAPALRERREESRSGLRGALSVARPDGADELHGRRARDSCEIWAPTQMQTAGARHAAQSLGLKPEDSHSSTPRFSAADSDAAADRLRRRSGARFRRPIGKPVKVTWSREDDMQHDYYRPASYCKFTAGLDADGKPTAFTASVACQSVSNPSSGSVKDNSIRKVSRASPISSTPFPNILVDYQLTDNAIPIGFWRSVGASQNGFFSESFVDELAAAAKKDPYEFRRRLTGQGSAPARCARISPRRKRDWGKPLPEGRTAASPCLNPFQSYERASRGGVGRSQGPHLSGASRRLAMDCGQRREPFHHRGANGGRRHLGHAMLKDEITIDKGRVVQTNFNNYQMLRINEMPKIEVHIVPSTEKPTGVGEPGVPCLAPAVCNAIFAATGKRIRRLPIRAEDLT